MSKRRGHRAERRHRGPRARNEQREFLRAARMVSGGTLPPYVVRLHLPGDDAEQLELGEGSDEEELEGCE